MDKKNTPEVKLGQYKGLAVTRHVRPVTDKTVDIELVHQTRMHAVYRPTTEPAKRGFRALLAFAVCCMAACELNKGLLQREKWRNKRTFPRRSAL